MIAIIDLFLGIGIILFIVHDFRPTPLLSWLTLMNILSLFVSSYLIREAIRKIVRDEIKINKPE